jgi:hypothetical protein
MAQQTESIIGLSVALIISFALLAPWVLYAVGLSHIEGRPTLPVNVKMDSTLAKRVWHEAGEKGDIIEIEPLTPYSYLMAIFTGKSQIGRGSKIVMFVVRDFRTNHLKNRRMLVGHLSSAALIIWLTRNWTQEQLLAKAFEIQSNRKQ